jgi:hypothetical protein
MRGYVDFNFYGDDDQRRAILHDDHHWEITPPIEEPVIHSYLIDRLNEINEGYHGPEDGWFGRPQIMQAAEYLKGKPYVEPFEMPDDPNAVY